jgi:acyl-coenzyme A thioesterase PaaI-like protein
MTEAFYLQEAADRFVPTELTRGPWDAGAQHGGPPSALAGHAIENRPDARADMRVTRLSVELMRPVPIAPLNVTTRVVHGGRSVEVVEAVLTPDDGRPVLRASAQRIRTDPDADHAADPQPAVRPPDGLPERPFPLPYEVAYHTGIETRFASGAFSEPGPATCWMRMRVPLVEGHPIAPLSRALIAADSGNGVSGVLDWRDYVFINPDLSVHLHRYPEGEWVCIESCTTLGGAGIAMADTAMHDVRGPIGRAAQSLLIAPRPG